jgi:hypothetical protein
VWCRKMHCAIFYLIFENFKGVGFTVLIFRFIFGFAFDGLCPQKQTKNGSKMRTMSTPIILGAY